MELVSIKLFFLEPLLILFLCGEVGTGLPIEPVQVSHYKTPAYTLASKFALSIWVELTHILNQQLGHQKAHVSI